MEIVLVRLRNEKPDVSHFFYPIHPICSYSKFVLIRGPTLHVKSFRVKEYSVFVMFLLSVDLLLSSCLFIVVLHSFEEKN